MKENSLDKAMIYDDLELRMLPLLLEQVGELGWDKVSKISEDFFSLTLQYE